MTDCWGWAVAAPAAAGTIAEPGKTRAEPFGGTTPAAAGRGIPRGPRGGLAIPDAATVAASEVALVKTAVSDRVCAA